MTALLYIVTGILFLMVPHFVLPLSFIEGGRNAWLLTECSFWYHPESICGLLAIGAGIVRFRSRAAAWPVAAAVLLAIIDAALLKPVSYYLQNEENLVILGQTISLRAHLHLRLVLILLAGMLIAGMIIDFVMVRGKFRCVSLSTLALGNLRRRIFRTTALVLALAVVIGAFFTDVLLTRSISNTLEIGIGRLGADLVVVPAGREKDAREILLNGTPNVFTLPDGVLEELRQWPEIDRISPQIFFRPFSYLVCCTTEQVLLVGYDPVTDFTIAPWVSYFLRDAQKNNELVVGAQVKFYPGHRISLFGKLFTVVASLDETGIGYFDRTAFLPIAGARDMIRHLKTVQMTTGIRKRKATADLSLTHLFEAEDSRKRELAELNPDGISALFIKVAADADLKQLAAAIREKIAGVTPVNVRTATASIKRQLTSLLDAFFLPIIILLVMGTVILAAIFGMSANERQREVGLLRAMGATRWEVFQLFLSESLLIAFLGAVFGILGGGALLILFKEKIMAALNLLYIWPGPMVITQVFALTLVVTVCIGVGAGLYPALKAARLEPYQAFRGH